jgi:hypothetical protein
MMKFISTVQPEFKVGQVDDEIIFDARQAGLSEAGIAAMITGDRRTFKAELDALAKSNPGSVWACMAGFPLWFNTASKVERTFEYKRIDMELRPCGNIRYP